MPLRAELELRCRFLNRYGIKSPFDFRKFVDILPRHHIEFVALNERKLVKRLRRAGFTTQKIREVLGFIVVMKSEAWPSLQYLRQEVRLKNVRRNVDPLDLNAEVFRALKEWAAKWPEAPKRLKKR